METHALCADALMLFNYMAPTPMHSSMAFKQEQLALCGVGGGRDSSRNTSGCLHAPNRRFPRPPPAAPEEEEDDADLPLSSKQLRVRTEWLGRWDQTEFVHLLAWSLEPCPHVILRFWEWRNVSNPINGEPLEPKLRLQHLSHAQKLAESLHLVSCRPFVSLIRGSSRTELPIFPGRRSTTGRLGSFDPARVFDGSRRGKKL